MSTTRSITICAINGQNTPQSFDRDIPISVKLLYADNLEPVHDRVLTFAENSELAIKKETSRCTLGFTFVLWLRRSSYFSATNSTSVSVLRFSESCASHENKHFVLSASSLDPRSVLSFKLDKYCDRA